nr:immunoglobulin heavy chain junction region [Macaca mulatta]MOX60048.1 immunoglobulin heavy chain junction region [Macaca mulatta]MOX61064.1 immunoglobulin heavy chain junction region [Macaca mulatta]MOX61128.1 immunoglobulin heavy chain junction region [Macaca mulatta]MOX64233.1 immunoglobulin heavy chain junction region [Macaca mulatta]
CARAGFSGSESFYGLDIW